MMLTGLCLRSGPAAGREGPDPEKPSNDAAGAGLIPAGAATGARHALLAENAHAVQKKTSDYAQQI